MNEQTSKKIFFNKSTLFSLKAELIRKQEEVNEKKRLPQHKLENFKAPSAKHSNDEKSTGKEHKKSFKDSLKAVDTEEIEACRKAKLALEKKAELYEHLSDGAGNSQLADRFLVDFNTKKLQEPVQLEPETTQDEVEQITTPCDDDEWTEFTDCLGRTRKCHKSDLDMYLERDKMLMKALNHDKDIDEHNETEDPAPVKEKPELVQKTNDYLQSLREKWEQKEREMLAKDKDIHYQDLLFDEARIHGVGYYSFSTDETERRKQMEELVKQREETLRAQQEAEQMRKKRDEMMAARVAAARARQRARAGLPPEDPKEKQKDFTTCLLEFLNQQKNEADMKAKEEERKIKEEKEKERQKLREAYIREWDLGKDGIDDKVKKFREMTQEEYVEQQRGKRLDEFAPPQASSSSNANMFDDKGHMIGSDGASAKSWADVRPKVKTPPPPDIGDLTNVTETKGLYFSSKKTEFAVKYKNFVKAQEPVPIINELEGVEYESNELSEDRYQDVSGAEIAPPPTYDYYGPVPKKMKHQKPFESDLSEAYEQGSKSLETKSTDRKLPRHYDFTFD